MYVLNLVISFIMDELGFTLTGFIVCYLLIYMVGIVYAVCEWRRWKLAGWVVPLAVFMPVVAPFIFPVVAHAVRPELRTRGVDWRIIRLKLVLAWAVPIFVGVGSRLCGFFCNRMVVRDFSEELALCCCLACTFLYLSLMFWINAQLNALSGVYPAKGSE